MTATKQRFQFTFSDGIHWRSKLNVMPIFERVQPNAVLYIPGNEQPLTPAKFKTFIEELTGGYHADRMPVTVVVTSTLPEFINLLTELISHSPLPLTIFNPPRRGWRVHIELGSLLEAALMMNAVVSQE